MIRNPLKKAAILLAVVVILIFLVAAGIDTASYGITDVISRSVVTVDSHYLVMIGLLSAWLLIIGLMCITLENIPGIKSDRRRSSKS